MQATNRTHNSKHGEITADEDILGRWDCPGSLEGEQGLERWNGEGRFFQPRYRPWGQSLGGGGCGLCALGKGTVAVVGSWEMKGKVGKVRF